MYGITGIIATIIAAVKGHKGFAWFTGIWTAIAYIIAFSGGSQYAVAPGFLFLIIAITMKKEGSDKPSDATQGPSASETEPPMRFICSACGNYSTGWYQTCPHCGAVGKMEKAKPVAAPQIMPADTEINPSESAQEETPQIESKAPARFCRECGQKLLPEAVFCPECGTRIIRDIVVPMPAPEVEAADNLRLIPTIEETEEQELPNTPVELPEIKLAEKGLPPLLRRAFLLIEDEDWEKADGYLERILDDEPENAFAYLGKLMIEKRVNELEKLSSAADQIAASGNYKKAVRYATDEDLIGYLQMLPRKPGSASVE